MARMNSRKNTIDVETALGHGVCSLIEAALQGDEKEVAKWAKRLAGRFESAGNLTAAARIRSLIRRSPTNGKAT